MFLAYIVPAQAYALIGIFRKSVPSSHFELKLFQRILILARARAFSLLEDEFLNILSTQARGWLRASIKFERVFNIDLEVNWSSLVRYLLFAKANGGGPC